MSRILLLLDTYLLTLSAVKACTQMCPKRRLSLRYTRIKDTQSFYLEVSSLSAAF